MVHTVGIRTGPTVTKKLPAIAKQTDKMQQMMSTGRMSPEQQNLILNIWIPGKNLPARKTSLTFRQMRRFP